MIDSKLFFEELISKNINFFAGVPDSLLKDFCAYVDDNCVEGRHIITANEGNAVALAAGYNMATGHIAAVYMQNSGLGNTVNPLTSLVDKEVYKIPVLLIIGWRGEPGVKDEPQHVKQGRVTEEQLKLLEIPYLVLDSKSDYKMLIEQAVQKLSETNAPVAILVRKDAFQPYKSTRKKNSMSALGREEALKVILSNSTNLDAVVSTTGKTSREVFEIRKQLGSPQKDFLTVGAMGHTASIALGVAIGQPKKRVLCLDGDGSLLMHMGALPIIGDVKPSNLYHFILNNSAHESVGGQPTVAHAIDFKKIAEACGYSSYRQVSTAAELDSLVKELSALHGPLMIEVKIKSGSREDLSRPDSTPEENKKSFINHLRNNV